MTLQNSAKNEAGCRSHLFEGMRVQMKSGIAIESFRTSGRQSNTGTNMDQRRNIELLSDFPQRLIGLVIKVTVIHGVGRYKQSAMAQLYHGTLCLFYGQLGFLHWNHGDSEQSLLIWRTMFGQPIVVSAKECGRELGMADTAKPKRMGGKERYPVDSFVVHHLEASLCISGQLKKILATGFRNKPQRKTTCRPVVARAVAILESRCPR